MSKHHRTHDPGRFAAGQWRNWTWWKNPETPLNIHVERDDDGTLHIWLDDVKTDTYPEGFEPEPEWLHEPPLPTPPPPQLHQAVRAWQRIVGAPATGDYDADTLRLTAEWQAKHLPDLPEAHRGYMHHRNWQKAAALGHCVAACTCDAPGFDHAHHHDCAVHHHRVKHEPAYAAAEKRGAHKAARQARFDERRLRQR